MSNLSWCCERNNSSREGSRKVFEDVSWNRLPWTLRKRSWWIVNRRHSFYHPASWNLCVGVLVLPSKRCVGLLWLSGWVAHQSHHQNELLSTLQPTKITLLRLIPVALYSAEKRQLYCCSVTKSGILCGILSGIFSDILSGIHSDILSGTCSGIIFGINSSNQCCIFSYILLTLLHTFWAS